MSMTIDENYYLNSTYQSTQVVRTEGVEQADSETEQTASQVQAAVPRMDRVEISEEGLEAGAKLQKQKMDASAAESYEPEDLSEYLDYELKQMYYQGALTRQEYEEETGEVLE